MSNPFRRLWNWIRRRGRPPLVAVPNWDEHKKSKGVLVGYEAFLATLPDIEGYFPQVNRLASPSVETVYSVLQDAHDAMRSESDRLANESATAEPGTHIRSDWDDDGNRIQVVTACLTPDTDLQTVLAHVGCRRCDLRARAGALYQVSLSVGLLMANLDPQPNMKPIVLSKPR